MKKDTDKYKLTETVSIVSHQLKTPLSVIKGYVEVLLSGDLGKINEGQREYLNDVFENTTQMISLIKDILDVTKIEEGKMEFSPESTNLTEIVKEIVKEFSFLAKAKNCELSFNLPENLSLVNVDPGKIKEVVSNLISNAINYNKRKGSVKVSLFEKRKRVVFCCQDTGIGIAQKEKNKMFTKFFRSERAIPIIASGSGLGLFISKAIIKESGGKIWFESKIGKGSTFCFSFPIKK